MRFRIEGREYEFGAKLTVSEAMFIQDKANLGIREFDAALLRGNPYATAAMVYIAKTRAGEAVRWQDLMGLDILTFEAIPDRAETDVSAEPAPESTDQDPT